MPVRPAVLASPVPLVELVELVELVFSALQAKDRELIAQAATRAESQMAL